MRINGGRMSRKVTVEVPFEGKLAEALNKAAKLLYAQQKEDECGVKMLSERKGNIVISTMTFEKKKKEDNK